LQSHERKEKEKGENCEPSKKPYKQYVSSASIEDVEQIAATFRIEFSEGETDKCCSRSNNQQISASVAVTIVLRSAGRADLNAGNLVAHAIFKIFSKHVFKLEGIAPSI
jgi:hypothetical protein